MTFDSLVSVAAQCEKCGKQEILPVLEWMEGEWRLVSFAKPDNVLEEHHVSLCSDQCTEEYIKTNSPVLCRQCQYLMKGNPSICNAFHLVGLTECPDFLPK